MKLAAVQSWMFHRCVMCSLWEWKKTSPAESHKLRLWTGCWWCECQHLGICMCKTKYIFLCVCVCETDEIFFHFSPVGSLWKLYECVFCFFSLNVLMESSWFGVVIIKQQFIKLIKKKAKLNFSQTSPPN